jgi:hypothetical protein
MPAWEVAGVPEECGLFVLEIGQAAGNIIKHDELIRGAEEESGAEFPLVNADKMAEVGARLAVASLVEYGLLNEEVLRSLRTAHTEDDITTYSVSEGMFRIIRGLEDKTIYAAPASEEGR